MEKYKIIKQIDETDCGAACLATICSFYKKKTDVQTIRSFAKVDQYGANMLGLCTAAEKLGFDAEGLFGNIKSLLLENIDLPCIAHIIVDNRLEHFVVLFEISKTSVVLGDPARGVQNYTIEGFEAVWTGHILTLKPNSTFQKEQRRRNSVFLPFLKLAVAHKKTFAFVAFLSLISTTLSVGASFFSHYLIDIIVPNKSVGSIYKLIVVLIVGNAIILTVNLIRSKMIATVSKKISTKLMCKYVSHLLDVDFDFYNQHTSGDMISRLQDSNIVREAVTKVIITATFDFVMIMFSFVVLAILNNYLFVTTLVITACYAFSVGAFGDSISRTTEELRRLDSTASTTFLETVKGIETIKSYKFETEAYRKNEQALSELMDSYKIASIIFSKQLIISDSIISVGQVLVLSLGSLSVIHGDLTLGILFMFYVLFGLSLTPIKNMVELLPTLDRAKVSAKRLVNVFSFLCEKKEKSKICNLTGDISIQHISYRYGNRELTLNDLSLDITEGEQIAIVGGSGSGKSTLAKIILRLYEAESGNIQIGNMPIKDLPLGDLREKIAYIPQSPFIFCGTIMDNIKVGAPLKSEKEIADILNTTPFYSFIANFPNGYESIITESGDNLSRGQKQMIAIARAIVKCGDILIMDEAYSSIDVSLREIARESINSAYSKSTRIIITHNPAEAQACDRIAILSGGKVEAVGNHCELIRTNLFYQNFCKT